MPSKKTRDTKVEVGNITTNVSGEVNIVGGDIYKGFTAEQVSVEGWTSEMTCYAKA